MFQALSLGVAASLVASTSACGTPRNEAVGNDKISEETTMSSANEMPAPPGGAPVSKKFATLDDYLAWLRDTHAPVDGPYYEEVSPGSYKLRTGNLRILPTDGAEAPTEQTFSRAQLLKQFGFSR